MNWNYPESVNINEFSNDGNEFIRTKRILQIESTLHFITSRNIDGWGTLFLIENVSWYVAKTKTKALKSATF